VIVIHPKGEQRLASTPLRLGQHDSVGIGAGVEERLHVLESLPFGGGHCALSSGVESVPRIVPTLVG